MTPLQNDILTVLRINPTPLMTSTDIVSVLNEWGAQKSASGVGSTCSALYRRIGPCLVRRKCIFDGRIWGQINPNRWEWYYSPRFGYKRTVKTYYWLSSRQYEVWPTRLIGAFT